MVEPVYDRISEWEVGDVIQCTAPNTECYIYLNFFIVRDVDGAQTVGTMVDSEGDENGHMRSNFTKVKTLEGNKAIKGDYIVAVTEGFGKDNVSDPNKDGYTYGTLRRCQKLEKDTGCLYWSTKDHKWYNNGPRNWEVVLTTSSNINNETVPYEV